MVDKGGTITSSLEIQHVNERNSKPELTGESGESEAQFHGLRGKSEEITSTRHQKRDPA